MKKFHNSPVIPAAAGRRDPVRPKKGFTLTEMLISVLLLGFVSVMVTVMSSAILSSTVTMREVAQAEILGSEALDNLQGRLRVAPSVTIDADGNVIFDIDDANRDYTFGVEDGVIVLGKVPKEGEPFKGDPLFAGVSYGSLDVSGLQFSAAEGAVEISVAVSYGGKTLWSGSVSVRPLNGMVIV